MKSLLIKFCLLTFILAALSSVAHADIFYKARVSGKITHVSLISDTQKIGQFSVDVAFSSHKCRATLRGEVIPCQITTYPTKDREGLLCYSTFKVALNLPAIVKKSCHRDNRCEQLEKLIRTCHPHFYEVSFHQVRVLGLNDRSKANILQIDTPSKEEAFHIISKVRWPKQK